MDGSIGIGDLAALVTVVGLAIYVLGLIGLAVTISFAITGDLSTAWYVVSLIPRIVVAGQGMRLWLGWPLVLTAVMLIAAPLVRHTVLTLGLFGSQGGLQLYLAFFLLALLVASLPVVQLEFFEGPQATQWARGAEFRVEWTTDHSLEHGRRTQRRVQMRNPLYLFANYLGVCVMALGSVVGENALVIGTGLLFFGAFIVGIPAAIRLDPPLPEVIISKRSNGTKKNTEPLKGRLVTHRDGFWHLFNEDNELLSIPDDQVLTVRIIGKTHTTPEEEEKPGEGKTE